MRCVSGDAISRRSRSSGGQTPAPTEQFAARELVRDWAAGSGATEAVRDIEQGEPNAWRPVFDGLAGLGLFGVAVPEDCGGAGGSIEDLAAMVEEAAKALVPGPVATTALATLVVSDPKLRAALAAGERTAGVALDSDVEFDETASQVSGTVPWVLGGVADGLLLVPAGDAWLLVDPAQPTGRHVSVEPLQATDFSRPLARVVLTSAPASVIDAPVADLTATMLSAEAAGITRWALDTAVAYAKVREQFGKPIGSFQAIKHLCAEMLCRTEQVAVAAADAARAAQDGDQRQLSIAAAIAAGVAIDAVKANAKDCIQVLGGIGITWEHDAHLYLRRAYGIGQFLGGPARWLRRTAELTQDGVRRDLSIDLSEVADLRPEIADAVAGVAALARRQAAGEAGRSGAAGAALARAVRPRRRTGRAVADRSGDGVGRRDPTRPGDRLVGGADHPRARHTRAGGAVRAGHPERRNLLVPTVFRARSRLGPGVAAHQSGAGRRRLGADRTEGVDVVGAQSAVGCLPGPHRPRRPETQRASPTS